MKQTICTIFFVLTFALQSNAQVSADSIEVIDEFKTLYKYQNFYLAGQPSVEALEWLKLQGVNKIINLRSEKENKDFSKTAFNENNYAEKLGMEYFSIPVSDQKDYSPANLAKMDSIITENDVVLIHCAGAGRVTPFFMAYLVKSKNYSLDQAVELGKNLKFFFPLETLLDQNIKMELKE
jgi:protein tyrosine phosphatase (PTP) superfamily phosphohydrolase (DUF442 family)